VESSSRKSNPVVTETPAEASNPIGQKLAERPYEFSFFQAVRLLQRVQDGGNPVGYFSEPSREAVRFGADPTLAFPPAEIKSLTPGGAVPRMSTNFFGLIGPQGVLPVHYTAFLIERLLVRDTSAAAFIDIFQHRILSLFYRAWEKHRFEIAYERRGQDSLSPHLLDLIGLGTPGLQNRQSVSDVALIAYAGLLSQFPHSSSILEQIIADYFDVPVEVQPFAGTWRKIDPASWTRLANGKSRTEQLGVGTVLGDEVWDQQSLVRIRIGPLPLERYKQFLPDGDAYRPLLAIQRFVCGEDIDVEVQLVLARQETPRCGIGIEGPGAPRLGWISWMFSRPLTRDPDETVLSLWQLGEPKAKGVNR
jgi:type VI secretion system protein ImpH